MLIFDWLVFNFRMALRDMDKKARRQCVLLLNSNLIIQQDKPHRPVVIKPINPNLSCRRL